LHCNVARAPAPDEGDPRNGLATRRGIAQSDENKLQEAGVSVDFVHLRVRSEYSVGRGAIRLKALPGLCAEAATPAVAVTDANNLFGALEFSETCAKAGVQPIPGLSIALAYAEAERPGDAPPPPAEIALLAQSAAGYAALMKLTSKAYLDPEDGPRKVTLADLEAHAEGLICLTGGPDGPLGRLARAGKTAQAEALLDRLAALYPGRLYVEIQRHAYGEARRTPDEAATEPFFVEAAYARDLPLVGTNDAHFPEPELYQAHDAFLCIGEGAYVSQDNRLHLTQEHWFKPARAMAEVFADLPEAAANTVAIARRCAFRPTTCAPILPRFADDEVEELRRQSEAGLAARLEALEDGAGLAAPRETYAERLEYELGVIEQMGFPGYFLIVADFIKWAKAQDIPVGPGRGSGAGSLVAWALTITDLDPLRYGLLFERFLNPERVSMPDFDIDFCMDRREEVIGYVQRKYGQDRVAQIITFGAMLSKAAVRDVGRVMQLPFGLCDRLSKMIPVEGVKPVSVKRARKEEPRLQEMEKEEAAVTELLDIAERTEGLLRNASTHAAGVVIGDRPLDELVPLYRDPRSDMPATQFNMKWVEQAGLVKFDFLGLKTLTVIQNALDLLKRRGVEIDIGAIPLDDEKTYALYGRADTVAVFQVESSGMRDALRQLQPTCIEDIVALVALYRPGPMENIPKYCNVKNGREKRASIHKLIDPILDETQGIIVYQEQVMEIARKMAGYSLGGADLLRRAMGKKIQAAMDAEKPKFLEGAKERRRRQEGRGGLEPSRQVRQLRLQQVARRRLWRGQLPDRLAEGESPGRVHGRGDELRHPPHRQALGLQARGRPAGDRDHAALREPLQRRFRGGGGADPLRAGRAEGRGAGGDAADRGGAGRGRPVPRPVRLRPPRRPQARRQAGAGDAGARRRLRRAAGQPPAGLRQPRFADRLFRGDAGGGGLGPGVAVRRRRGAADAAARRGRRLDPDRAAGRGARRGGLLPLRPSARRLSRAAPAQARAVLRRPAAGRRRGAGGGLGDEAAGAEIGPRQPLRLRRTVRPDRDLRGHGVLGRAGRQSRPAGAGVQRGAERRGRGGGRPAQTALPRRDGGGRRGVGRRRRRAAGVRGRGAGAELGQDPAGGGEGRARGGAAGRSS
jgi:DNA-directed DNA polymerase III PolC